MLPNINDYVMFSDQYLKTRPNLNSLKGRALKIISLKPRSIGAKYIKFDIAFLDGNSLKTDTIEMDINGDYQGGGPVFSYSVNNNSTQASSSYSSTSTQINQQHSSQANEDDRCKKCGTMGEKKGMSCVCPACGNVIWGI